MVRSSLIALLVSGAVVAGCETDLGSCDEAAARTVYFSNSGKPLYGGQALVVSYCTTGCHSASAEGKDRRGVPAGLDFDMNLAGSDAELVALLKAGQHNVYEWRGEAYEWVEAQTMPPPGLKRSGVEYATLDGEMLPGLDEAAGHELLRNWLSCGAPVVEKSQQPTPTSSPGDACTEGAVGDCRVEQDAMPIEPRWSSLYSRYFGDGATCRGCHETEAQASAFNTTFVMGSTAQSAYDSMVGVMTDADGVCGGQTIVVAGSAEQSNLVHKLERQLPDGGGICGAPMPLSGQKTPASVLQAVRDWIDAGAMNN